VGPIVVMVVAAAIPALLLFSLARWANGRAEVVEDAVPAPDPSAPMSAPPVAAPALNTGLMSFRRASNHLSRELNMAAFQQGVQPLMNAVDDNSCAAISLDGELVGERNIDKVVIPASNMKILVAAAAMDVLGADFRYTTRVVGPEPIAGVIEGDVFLVGGGDPLLSGDWYAESDLDRFPAFNSTSIDDLARSMAASGVTQINGTVRGDGSRYDDEMYAPGWGADVAGIEAGPYDALLVNDARVLGDDQRASDPSEAGAREFVRALGEQGITVSGGSRSGAAPAGASELASIQSQPLPAVLAEMLTNSDNNTAELMLKEIGLAAAGSGTRQAGIDATVAALADQGIDTNGLVIADGSGLSLDNRITCRTMIEVLQHWGYESPVGQGLAIGGETGTLSDAFVDTSVGGRIRGKTGTLNNLPYDQDPPAVKALSGYMPVEGGEAIEYTLLLNGGIITDQSNYRPIWDELVNALTAYPAVASPQALGPQ
jgi:D-alanyl-D-alanine carboxypeptidase/D-alanyl-D-alanine-endopeptidase (penicillin-binding protein 4)